MLLDLHVFYLQFHSWLLSSWPILLQPHWPPRCYSHKPSLLDWVPQDTGICHLLPEGPSVQFSRSVVSSVQVFVTPWTAARQASLSITNSQSLLKLMFIESVMPSNHLILCHALLLLPSIFPSIRVFSSESVLLIRWPKYWSFSFRALV